METRVFFHIFSLPITETIFFTWVVMAILTLISIVFTRNLQRIPRGMQNVLEIAVDGIENMVYKDMGKRGSGYVPLILTIALFILTANLISIVPGAFAPTQDLNTTAALALIVFFVAHGSEIRVKGLGAYVKSYFQPYFWMFPINVVGEIAKVLSHAFRLYGNILGGTIIIGILYMFAPYVLPVPLMAWFGLFMGVIQTAVFTLLAVAYIQVRLE